MPKRDITQNSPKEDIMWIQEKLNKAVPDCQYVPLKVDGIYSPKVRIAVLMFGNQRDGSRMGKIPDGLWDQEPERHWHS